jgi:hypothetical protein
MIDQQVSIANKPEAETIFKQQKTSSLSRLSWMNQYLIFDNGSSQI